MSPHEQAEEFISSYRKLMQGDSEVSNFQKVLEMKVSDSQVQQDTSVQQPGAWFTIMTLELT